MYSHFLGWYGTFMMDGQDPFYLGLTVPFQTLRTNVATTHFWNFWERWWRGRPAKPAARSVDTQRSVQIPSGEVMAVDDL